MSKNTCDLDTVYGYEGGKNTVNNSDMRQSRSRTNKEDGGKALKNRSHTTNKHVSIRQNTYQELIGEFTEATSRRL